MITFVEPQWKRDPITNHILFVCAGVYIANSNMDLYMQKPACIDYGVSDNLCQILNWCRERNIDGQVCIRATPIFRDAQPHGGGWRWHKWGDYIGTKTPTEEYLSDEAEIEFVYAFTIYGVDAYSENTCAFNEALATAAAVDAELDKGVYHFYEYLPLRKPAEAMRKWVIEHGYGDFLGDVDQEGGGDRA